MHRARRLWQGTCKNRIGNEREWHTFPDILSKDSFWGSQPSKERTGEKILARRTQGFAHPEPRATETRRGALRQKSLFIRQEFRAGSADLAPDVWEDPGASVRHFPHSCPLTPRSSIIIPTPKPHPPHQTLTSACRAEPGLHPAHYWLTALYWHGAAEGLRSQCFSAPCADAAWLKAYGTVRLCRQACHMWQVSIRQKTSSNVRGASQVLGQTCLSLVWLCIIQF